MTQGNHFILVCQTILASRILLSVTTRYRIPAVASLGPSPPFPLDVAEPYGAVKNSCCSSALLMVSPPLPAKTR